MISSFSSSKNNEQLPWGKSFVLIFLAIILLSWVAYLFSNYWDRFGGDPEIHLIFAKNFLNGHFLEFNPGYKTGGETSILYMFLTALLFKAFGVYTQLAMKIVGFFSLFFICLAIYRASIYSENDTSRQSSLQFKGFFISLLFLSMCFVPFQAGLGMENILWAAGLSWFVLKQLDTFSANWKFLVLSLVLFLLRPEAILISFFYLFYFLFSRKINSLWMFLLVFLTDYSIYKFLSFLAGVNS